VEAGDRPVTRAVWAITAIWQDTTSIVCSGLAVIGGMLVSTFLTLFVVPAMYMFVSSNRNKSK
jgi:multidrug efflux pump subunit AcrB